MSDQNGQNEQYEIDPIKSILEPKISIPIDEYIEEEPTPEGTKVRHKGVFLLPNLFTTAALFAAFYSIICSMHIPLNEALATENITHAAIAIFIAMVMDGLDGRVARLTNTQSAFGAEYDSLSDMVAFGLAPALLAFQWSLSNAGKLGWMVAFIYVACAALRLARFNTQIGTVDKQYFIGLASPSAAAVVAGAVWCFTKLGVSGDVMVVPLLMLVLMAGVLMVSNIKYYSFKGLDLKGRVPFIAIIIIVLIFAVIGAAPAYALLTFFFCYTISGPALFLWKLKKSKSQKNETLDKG